MLTALAVMVAILLAFVLAIAQYTLKLASKINRLDRIIAEHLAADPRYSRVFGKEDTADGFVRNGASEP